MTAAFHDIDPYEVLAVANDASPIEIKKAYKRLCLKHHPDKLQQQNQHQSDADLFPRIQLAYSVLSDPARRLRYDRTGTLAETIEGDDFDWKEYFDAMNNKITIEMIEEDRAKYQGSDEEKEDILKNFVYYDGDFLRLFELIPHLEFTEEAEDRVFKIIQNEQAANPDFMDKHATQSWEKYCKSRKTKVKLMLKKLAKEAKEAEELEKKIKDKGKRNLGKESDLAALIQSRQSNRMDGLIASLESKYVDKKGKKRATKEISDDDFEKIQAGLNKRKRTNG